MKIQRSKLVSCSVHIGSKLVQAYAQRAHLKNVKVSILNTLELL